MDSQAPPVQENTSDAAAGGLLPASGKGRRRVAKSSEKALFRSPLDLLPLPRWILAAASSGPSVVQTSESLVLDGEEQHKDDSDDAMQTAFAAGAAMLALDQLLRSDAPWLGALRMRLALKAAVAAALLLRLKADEAHLRDALHLTRSGDDPGEAGRLHLFIRHWASRSPRLAAEVETEILSTLGQEGGQPSTGASELAALLAADRALAEQMGWSKPLPLHLVVIHDAALRQGSSGRRPRADAPQWQRLRHAVLLRAAMAAHAEAVRLARRAEALTAAAATLRTRDEGRGLALILSDDSVAPWRMVGRHGLGSDRAARRLCESLQALGALRLLTDRPTFRLYGP